MEFSKKIIGECRAYGIKVNERAMGDLVAMGWTPLDAYLAAFGNNPVYNDSWHRSMMKEVLNKEGFKKYVGEQTMALGQKKKKTAAKAEKEAARLEAMSKEEVAGELLRTFRSLPVDDPKRSDVLMKYADLTQMKKTDDQLVYCTIHFYLPLSCKQCQLWMEYEERVRNGTKKGDNTP